MTLFYGGYAQVELSAPGSPRVLIDVGDPMHLSSPVTGTDVLLTTHTHWDHFNADFQSSFPGEQLMAREGWLAPGSVTIRGIASAHNEGDVFKPQGGTNYIYLIEMAGLRIAHFGDIGQKTLTEVQLEWLMPVDVAIIQLANANSDMDAANQKAFTLIEQVDPRLIIPTHVDLDTARLAVARWPGLYHEDASLVLCGADLPGQAQVLFVGQPATTFLASLDLQPVHWGQK
ncbi:MAG: MBL fold metallo-hydrolase [Chloroflexota bacterium]